MPRLVALEWNDLEARLAVASSRGNQAVVEQAFLVSLRPTGAGPDQPAVDVGQRLAAALAARGIGKLDALVAVGRTNVELRQLSLPPAPDEELPDMVRFQAMREFNALQDDWPLDFLPIDDVPDEPRTVLAAAIDPEQVAEIRGTCQKVGVRPKRMVLRPCAGASLLARLQGDARLRVRLLVDLLGDEADLTVLIDRKVIVLRTARLSCDPLVDPEGANLLGEIRRTMAAVQNQLGGRKVEAIVLCGRGPAHAALGEIVAERLATPAELFDPFEGLTLQRELQDALPEHPGRFAPLLGMLLDELTQTPPAVDFLQPRRRSAPPTRRRTYALAALAVTLLLALALVYGTLQWRSLGKQKEELAEDLKLWDAKAAVAAKDEKAAKEVDAWLAGDVVWLDELHRLAQKMPAAQDAMLSQLDLRAAKQGGEIRLEGVAKSVDALKKMEDALSDPTHRVVPKDKSESKNQKAYPLRFGSTVVIQPEKRGPVPAAPAREARR